MTSIRGGAGKSTVTALVAGVIRRYRGDQVVAVDADPGLGSLPVRLGASTASSLRHLAAAHPRSWEEIAPYLGRTAEGLFVLPAAPTGVVADEIDHRVFQQAAGRLEPYFSVAVVDCGGGLTGELQRSVIGSAHAQVFVAPGTVDGALSARTALNWFAQNGYGELLSRTVVALVAHTPRPDADLVRAREMLSAGGLPVVHVPFDRHLAAGVSIAPERTGGAAEAAATTIAAHAFVRSLDVP
ncbi:MinD/ParA family ATP-binding protein [Actinomadura fibrosa]|uniref:MinD/ParA family protein n=1 Tax=Actinomadura fibrosa TaxID=111802 RepID=A0ABW2XZM9_9ACTN|nr:type VII secretion protein [Actinomadura fibrosa]